MTTNGWVYLNDENGCSSGRTGGMVSLISLFGGKVSLVMLWDQRWNLLNHLVVTGGESMEGRHTPCSLTCRWEVTFGRFRWTYTWRSITNQVYGKVGRPSRTVAFILTAPPRR